MAEFTSKITFHEGSVREETTVSAMLQHGDDCIVMTCETPFHPRDYQWPDQPADKGYAEDATGKRHLLSDVVVVGIDPQGIFYVDKEIPVKKSELGWYFCVGHVIEGERPSFAKGDRIILQVDKEHREKLSRTHSATHLMALALDRTLAPLWRKGAPWIDALGNPNFDQLAIEDSAIGPLVCRDRYRMGKSLRKKGFSPERLKGELKRHEEAINAQIAEWLGVGSAVIRRAEGDHLTSYRYWRINLEDTETEVPCGGTHVGALSEIGDIQVTLEMPDDETLIITTSVR